MKPPQAGVEQDESGESRATKVTEQDNDCSGSDYDWHKSRSPKFIRSIFRTGTRRKTHYEHCQREELRAYKVSEQGNGVSSSDGQQHKKGGLRPRKPLKPPQAGVEQDESGESRATKVTEQDNDCSGSDYDWHKSRSPKLRKSFLKTMLAATQTIFRTRMGRKKHYEYDQSEELRAEKVNEQDNDISSSDGDQHKIGVLRPITELIPPQARVEIFRPLDENGEYLHLPVKKGVLLVLCLKERCTLELWNFQLSKCIERWSCLGEFQRVIPVSEELVCLISPSSREAKIFDTSSGYEQSAMCLPGKFIACNSKHQFLATLDSHPQTIVLLQGKTVIWKKYWPRSGYGNFICETFSFSPDNQFFVISGAEQGHGVYLLDAYSGSTLQMLWKGEADRSVFVSNDECAIQTSEPPSVTCLRLFNVRSGQQLSVLNIESQLTALTTCPWNGLIAICEKNTNHNFRVIPLRLSGDNEEKRTIKGQLSI